MKRAIDARAVFCAVVCAIIGTWACATAPVNSSMILGVDAAAARPYAGFAGVVEVDEAREEAARPSLSEGAAAPAALAALFTLVAAL